MERMSSRSSGVMKVELSASKIWRVIWSPSCSSALSSTTLTRRSSRFVLLAISGKRRAPYRFSVSLLEQLVEALLPGHEPRMMVSTFTLGSRPPVTTR